MHPPLVTVAIPLYRSGRFLDIIVNNIASLRYPNLEFLLSDRHLEDDALDRLRARFRTDPRCRFMEARDRVDWVTHYNSLLFAASGEYFFWMPHDDSYAPDYVDRLVAELETNRDVVLAFGSMKKLFLDGDPRTDPYESKYFPGDSWSPISSVCFLLIGNPGVAFRGIFRRRLACEKGLALRPTRGMVSADDLWVFAFGLLGRVARVPEAGCIKRYHAGCTHTKWVQGWREIASQTRVCLSYIRDYVPDVAVRRTCQVLLLAWPALRIAIRFFPRSLGRRARKLGRQLILRALRQDRRPDDGSLTVAGKSR